MLPPKFCPPIFVWCISDLVADVSTLPTKSSARVWWLGIQPCLQLGSWLEGGQGVPVSGHLAPGIQHRLPPTWCSSSPEWDQSYVPMRKWGPHLPWPPRLASWVSLQKSLVMTLPRQLGTKRAWGLQWNWLLRTHMLKHHSPQGTMQGQRRAEKH